MFKKTKKSYGGYGIDFTEYYAEQREESFKYALFITLVSFACIYGAFAFAFIAQNSIILAANQHMGLTLTR